MQKTWSLTLDYLGSEFQLHTELNFSKLGKCEVFSHMVVGRVKWVSFYQESRMMPGTCTGLFTHWLPLSSFQIVHTLTSFLGPWLPEVSHLLIALFSPKVSIYFWNHLLSIQPPRLPWLLHKYLLNVWMNQWAVTPTMFSYFQTPCLLINTPTIHQPQI